MLHTNSQAVINGGGISGGYPSEYGVFYHFGGYYGYGWNEAASFDLFASSSNDLYYRVEFNGQRSWQRLAT